MKKIPATHFVNLSWDDLEQWAGAAILERGKRYRRRVQDLAITDDHHLIAIVNGTEQYITHVWLEQGKPACVCSCPYWDDCKHAVAVILAYLDNIQSKTPVPLIGRDELEARLSVYGMAEDGYDEPDFNFEHARAALKKLTKAQLIEWAIEAFADDPSLFDTLPGTEKPANAAPDKIPDKTIARLRQHIRKTTSERGWRNSWDDSGYIPDYSPIKKQLETLLRSGHTEAVLELGEELLTLGNAQAEESDDEGETASELATCLAVVLNALNKSQQPGAEKMIWFWDKLLHDDFALFDGLTPPIDHAAMTRADWRQVAEEFTHRLDQCPKPENTTAPFSKKYHRERILKYAVKALSQAGEGQRATKLMVDELAYCENYVELVAHLLANKDHDQAEYWAYKGFNKTIQTYPGIAWSLLDRLVDIAGQRKDWSQVAALRVCAFLQMPSLENYKLAQKSCKKARSWSRTRDKLLNFLETGQSPLSADDWPLPDTALKSPATKRGRKEPDFSALIEIALYEKRSEDALRWFQQEPRRSYHDEAIAQAVKKTHPDVSLKIWQDKAEALIARVKPSAYREAMPYLKKMQSLMRSLKCDDDYRRYIAGLRRQHKAKRKLMEELDALNNNKCGRILAD